MWLLSHSAASEATAKASDTMLNPNAAPFTPAARNHPAPVGDEPEPGLEDLYELDACDAWVSTMAHLEELEHEQIIEYAMYVIDAMLEQAAK